MVAESDMPDHDLEPPRFCRRALERLLNDWPAVQCTIMAGIHEESNAQQLFGDQGQACRQSGTALLDKFTHLLLVKCNAEGVLVNLQQYILFFLSNFPFIINYVSIVSDVGYTANHSHSRDAKRYHSWQKRRSYSCSKKICTFCCTDLRHFHY